MKRLAMILVVLGTLWASASADAGVYYYRRPIGPVRAAVRAAAPPYRVYYPPRVYARPRVYYGPYWGPAYRPGLGVGVGVF